MTLFELLFNFINKFFKRKNIMSDINTHELKAIKRYDIKIFYRLNSYDCDLIRRSVLIENISNKQKFHEKTQSPSNSLTYIIENIELASNKKINSEDKVKIKNAIKNLYVGELFLSVDIKIKLHFFEELI